MVVMPFHPCDLAEPQLVTRRSMALDFKLSSMLVFSYFYRCTLKVHLWYFSFKNPKYVFRWGI